MFSQTTEYALRAMAMLAMQSERLVSTPELAESTKVPQNYLAKVLQQLAGADLIMGRRGVGGGYRLARPAKQIRLLDVISAVTPLRRIETCPLGIHGSNLCPLHRLEDEAVRAVITIYDGHTLADLVNGDEAVRPLCDARAAKLSVSAGSKRAST